MWNVTAAAAVASIVIHANRSSIVPGAPRPRPAAVAAHAESGGPLVRITAADARSAGPAAAAAALWNVYHPNYKGPLIETTVRTVPQAEVSSTNPNVVGVADCIGVCAPPQLNRWCCGVSELRVVDDIGDARAFDVFFHEIGHLVIPPNSVSSDGRVIDAGGHWNPEEPHEVFGATLEFPVVIADYTAAAPDPGGSAVCTPACNTSCGPSGAARSPDVCAGAGLATNTPAPEIILVRDRDCYYDDCTGGALVALGVMVCWVGLFAAVVWFIVDGDGYRAPPSYK